MFKLQLTLLSVNISKFWSAYKSLEWHTVCTSDGLNITRGVVTRGSEGSADPPDFGKSKKLSHKNAIKSEFSENWGQIGHSDPPDFWSSRRPWIIFQIDIFWRKISSCFIKFTKLKFAQSMNFVLRLTLSLATWNPPQVSLERDFSGFKVRRSSLTLFFIVLLCG